MSAPNINKQIQKGFTLIELTIGIAVLSVALLVMTGALFPQAERSTDPWFQVRSAELGHSLMNEIVARKFDENNFVLGELRCGEDNGTTVAPACATQTELNTCSTTEEGSRADFDDVDDFNCFSATGDQITDIIDAALIDVYKQFSVTVDVDYALAAKLITVTVTPPRGVPVSYSTYKANY